MGFFVFPAAPARADREENHFPGPQRPGGHGQVSDSVCDIPAFSPAKWPVPFQSSPLQGAEHWIHLEKRELILFNRLLSYGSPSLTFKLILWRYFPIEKVWSRCFCLSVVPAAQNGTKIGCPLLEFGFVSLLTQLCCCLRRINLVTSVKAIPVYPSCKKSFCTIKTISGNVPCVQKWNVIPCRELFLCLIPELESKESSKCHLMSSVQWNSNGL